MNLVFAISALVILMQPQLIVAVFARDMNYQIVVYVSTYAVRMNGKDEG